SRVPVSSTHFHDTHSTADDSAVYPLAGAIIAAPSSAIIALATFFPDAAWVLATIAVGTTIAVTGALHEDGLADVADGFFATQDKDRILTIMRDPHLGTFGTLALVISVILKIAAVATLINTAGAIQTAGALIGIEAASRAAMVWHWYSLDNVRPDGKAAAAGQPDEKAWQTALALGLALFALFAIALPGLWFQGATAIAACAMIATAFAQLCRTRIGGHTGDSVGATQQLTAVGMLAVLAISTNLPT
ncbi:MAG: adenosylcobinamide-GDP ribazoletransferase, partial [Pseudomonadota bacterium]